MTHLCLVRRRSVLATFLWVMLVLPVKLTLQWTWFVLKWTAVATAWAVSEGVDEYREYKRRRKVK